MKVKGIKMARGVIIIYSFTHQTFQTREKHAVLYALLAFMFMNNPNGAEHYAVSKALVESFWKQLGIVVISS